MMTDQIPLDLAPPPLLNGEVPLMPHMVNGDAAQQVNTRHGDTHAHTHTSVVCIHISMQLLLSTFQCCRTHTNTHTHPDQIARENTHQTVVQALLFVVISSHGSRVVATGNEQLLQSGIRQKITGTGTDTYII